ncbi:MAG: chemotaxis response regulator protein-glutamate methylesterase [Syntrophorhabdaceae bacterium]|nr:chemotaxis response regulator protein-glutamate methylesterase [Syntrophorhabdaceae bacterium]
MMTEKIKVLVVDDSAFMRGVISKMLESDAEIEVIGTAKNGQEAIEKVDALKPDVMTLDIEMPVMNGIEALKYIMEKNPLPVIMFSALTKEGAEITLEALSIGAADFMAKDFSNFSINIIKKENELVNKVKTVARKKRVYSVRRVYHSRASSSPVTVKRSRYSILALGASTGGPPAIEHILSGFPKEFPVPIIIAQHMPRLFTRSFAQRLNNAAQIEVKEAENGESLRSGTAFIAPGDSHMSIRRKGTEVYVEFVNDAKYIYRPSVDLLFSSTAMAYGEGTLCVILTGMGNDGLAGIKDIKSKNGYVIAQNEETCIVYGMPRAVVNANMADAVLPIDKIPDEIIKIL